MNREGQKRPRENDGKPNEERCQMKICPDCKHRNVGTVFCTHCGGELHKRVRSFGVIERIALDVDRLTNNTVYTR